jgi:DNA-binding transcriptional ArsR family regulator
LADPATRSLSVTPEAEPEAILLSPDLSAELAELFRALADPTRVRIVYALVQQDLTTSGLATLLGMNPPTISQHLRLLRTLRIVKPRREGQLVYYSLDDDHIRLLITLSLNHLHEQSQA